LTIHLKGGRLRGGTTIQIVVGTPAGEFSSSSSRYVWNVEQDLISHYSPTLWDAYNRPRHSHGQGTNEKTVVTLPEDDPYIFELFYMWMLDGTITQRTTSLVARDQAVNPDLQAWVFGDQMRSIGFKNYILNRIYDQHVMNLSPKAVTPADVAYVFKHTADASKLRQFYLDLFPKQWKSMPCISRDFQEWDNVVREHKDFRMRFYETMRPDEYEKPVVLFKDTYMEAVYVSPADNAVGAHLAQAVPAKRKVENVLVKEEIADY
jgi:hypothetical protein